MSETKEINTGSSVGLLTILFIVFLVLKLTGNIDWSWYWVFLPIWILPAIIIFFIFLFFLGGIFTGSTVKRKYFKNYKKEEIRR